MNYLRWFMSVSAKDIGVLYLVYALFAACIGSTLSYLIRLELAGSGIEYLAGNSHIYNVIITAHALVMIFYFLMPALLGTFANYLVPLMLVVLDMSFSRLYII